MRKDYVPDNLIYIERETGERGTSKVVTKLLYPGTIMMPKLHCD